MFVSGSGLFGSVNRKNVEFQLLTVTGFVFRFKIATWSRGVPPTWRKLPPAISLEPSGVTSIRHTRIRLTMPTRGEIQGSVNGRFRVGSATPVFGLSRASPERSVPPIRTNSPDA